MYKRVNCMNQEIFELLEFFPREIAENLLSEIKEMAVLYGTVNEHQIEYEQYLDERKGKEVLGGA